MRNTVEILCIGTELLSGKVNTHTAYLSALLRSFGFDVRREATLADSLEDIRDTVAAAAARSEIVLVCGGLGPTFDDLTRESVSAAFGRPLSYDARLYARIRRKFFRYRMRVPPSNKRQAWRIAGARVLANARGSAPGQMLTLAGRPAKTVALLPGPFSELKPMFEGQVLPALIRRYGGRGVARQTVFRFCGISEAAADTRLKSLLHGARGAEYTILAGPGCVEFHASVRASGPREADRRLGRIRAMVSRLMGPYLYGEGTDTLESVVGTGLKRKGWSLAAAESCTGGLLSTRLTSVPGSSDYFLGSVVAYHNRLKTALLGVREGTLKRHGAVSRACAREMARGARQLLGADLGVAITGIAGPGGGSREKPVGLVYIAWALPGKVFVDKLLLPGDRAQVRERAATHALYRLYRLLRRPAFS